MTSHPTIFDPPPDAAEFYTERLQHLVASGIPFMLSGTYALGCHTGIVRPTKDLDVFCKPGDAPRILAYFKKLGHRVEFEDERWIGKVWRGEQHYAPVLATVQGEPVEIFPFLGSSRLAEAIDRFENVRCAVHGHAHRGAFEGKPPRGVPVYNCAQFALAEKFDRPYALIAI